MECEKCEICNKKSWTIIFDFHGVSLFTNEILVDKKLLICHECMCVVIASLIKVVDKQNVKSVKNLIKDYHKGSVIPSIPWGKRQRMGEISTDELIDINLWISNLKNGEEFRKGR